MSNDKYRNGSVVVITHKSSSNDLTLSNPIYALYEKLLARNDEPWSNRLMELYRHDNFTVISKGWRNNIYEKPDFNVWKLIQLQRESLIFNSEFDNSLKLVETTNPILLSLTESSNHLIQKHFHNKFSQKNNYQDMWCLNISLVVGIYLWNSRWKLFSGRVIFRILLVLMSQHFFMGKKRNKWKLSWLKCSQ